ncbi:MAG TPA: glycosyltransferase [Patescibacteria group bacterium]|nr:glycosyltransferase [Patescibacteria group bacterium]
MKIAVVYDRVNKFGGAERVLLALHEIFPKAPLYTSLYSPDGAKWAEIFPEIKTSFLNKIKFLRDKHEFLAPIMPFVFERFDFSEYDLVISVTSEFAKNVTAKKHICYCLTPTRYLWSHYEEYFGNQTVRELLKPLILFLKDKDLEAAKKPKEIIAISTEVQKRIKKYYKREARIIFPPVNIYKYNYKSKSEYYLVVSRLVKYKKVDLVIEAFNEINKPLIIIGVGHEEKRLKKLAKKNIFFAGQVDDKELAKYYKNAKGFIFPQEEDFGITAVEAQSFGVPIIAYKKGGSLDTVNNKTGIFFEKQTKEELIEAVRKFEKKKFNKRVIQRNSKRFSKKRFKQEFLQFVKAV